MEMERFMEIAEKVHEETHCTTRLGFTEGHSFDSAGTYSATDHSIIMSYKGTLHMKKLAERTLGIDVDLEDITRIIMLHEIGHSFDPGLKEVKKEIDEQNDMANDYLFNQLDLDSYIHHIKKAGYVLLSKEIYAWKWARKWIGGCDNNLFYCLMKIGLYSYRGHVRDIVFNGCYKYQIIDLFEQMNKIDISLKEMYVDFDDRSTSDMRVYKKEKKLEINACKLIENIPSSGLSFKEYFLFHFCYQMFQGEHMDNNMKRREDELFGKAIENACEETFKKFIDAKNKKKTILVESIVEKTSKLVRNMLEEDGVLNFTNFVHKEVFKRNDRHTKILWEGFYEETKKATA